jgi:hypothetical protein
MGSPPSCRPYAVGDEEEGSELLAAGSPPPHLSAGSGDEVEVRYVRRSNRSPPQSLDLLLASTASPHRSLLLPATFGVPERRIQPARRLPPCGRSSARNRQLPPAICIRGERACIFASSLSSKAKCITHLPTLLDNVLVMHSASR